MTVYAPGKEDAVEYLYVQIRMMVERISWWVEEMWEEVVWL